MPLYVSRNNSGRTVKTALGILTVGSAICIICGIGVKLRQQQSSPIAPVKLGIAPTASTQANTPAALSAMESEKRSIGALFDGIVPWTTEDPAANVEIRECADGEGHDATLPVFQMKFTLTDPSTQGGDVVAVTAALPRLQRIIRDNGWRKCSGPDEPYFYYNTTYIKNGRLLGLNWGTRDAVIGGTYVIVQFEYNK